MKNPRRSILNLNLLHFLFLILLPFVTLAQIPPKPEPPRLVNDLAGLLTADEAGRLEQKLVDYNDSTSTQITVVTVSSLDGYDIDDMAQRIGQTWGAGQKQYDNGVIILIKPKVGNERGQAAISIGYGLEEIIPDALARRIVDNEMIPYFKQNNYYGGINAGTDIIIDLASGRFKASDYEKKGSLISGLVPLIIIIIVFLLIGRNSGNKRRNFGSSNLPLWIILSMLGGGGGGGRSSGSDWGGFSGGGSSGGGGFGGFGGGGFGGGGASGSW
ncbi:MAG: TPM domain-containing protein [Lentimicrobiaceae bacterium]|nr:TPM domain-containing protein [Lentimicrobiaceae bacterium]MCB9024182.1 TPM domain-containing protein [Lentimicrobiaceae bacterium]MCO5266550.1 TPM domain-containing protein [Lentimicrobium sp.]